MRRGRGRRRPGLMLTLAGIAEIHQPETVTRVLNRSDRVPSRAAASSREGTSLQSGPGRFRERAVALGRTPTAITAGVPTTTSRTERSRLPGEPDHRTRRRDTAD